MPSAETIAALLIIVNVALVAYRSVWNYPFAIAGVALYLGVFYEAKLYSDALLQIFFLLLNIYGWINWRRAQLELGDVVVERLGWAARGAWAGAIVLAALAWGAGMHRFTDAAYPWWDAGEAIASIAAQVLLARRKIENWALWIAVDIVSIGLYAAKALWPTMILYVILLALSVWGLVDWARAARRQARTSFDPA